jgi:hypothetical protein
MQKKYQLPQLLSAQILAELPVFGLDAGSGNAVLALSW